MAKPAGHQGKDKNVLLDALALPSELFGTSVEMVIERFREARAQSAAFKKYIQIHPKPLGVLARHSLITGGRPEEDPGHSCTVSEEYRAQRRRDARRKRKDLSEVINRKQFSKEDRIAEEQ